jgi:hypothetical protein
MQDEEPTDEEREQAAQEQIQENEESGEAPKFPGDTGVAPEAGDGQQEDETEPEPEPEPEQ